MGPETVAQGCDAFTLLVGGGVRGTQAGFQANDRFLVEAAPMPLSGSREPGMEHIRQVFEGEGLGHRSQGRNKGTTMMDPFRLRNHGALDPELPSLAATKDQDRTPSTTANELAGCVQVLQKVHPDAASSSANSDSVRSRPVSTDIM